MSDFKAMHRIVCRLGLRPIPRWGSETPCWILGPTSKKEERRGPPALPLHPHPLHSR